MGLITELCQSIDAYNNIERNVHNSKSWRLKLEQRKVYKNLKKVINKFNSDTILDVDMMNDFYFNYMATIDTIGELDNCECIYNEIQKQFIFTIKNANGSVAFSTYKIRNPIIDLTINYYNFPETKRFRYLMNFVSRTQDMSNERYELGLKCEELLKDCISKYLLMRLDLYKEG